MLVQRLDFSAHDIHAADDVARVGVLRSESQRAAFAVAADQDRHSILERARVAQRLRNVEDATLEPRRALPPHQGEQLQRILEERIALVHRRKRPAVGVMLRLEPAEAEAADGTPGREHVERRDDLREVRDVPIGDAGDERAETHA